ncbi:hypothetical protein B0H11DRAFT_2047763 [Mycena galericulata]|nr:hypothetical protein B0H11DRAFT_2058457 [Mycena galericulata]KAJ7466810.1 hypothetical protein B0H11DRAFT_2047763 [Mycena galericulata]
MDREGFSPADLGKQLLASNYLHLLGITILYWDHTITLDAEINLVWSRAKSLSSWCFFVNRYFAFLSEIPAAASPFLSVSMDICLRFSLFRELVLFCTQVITGVVMIIRVYALFGRSRRIFWSMIAAALCPIGVAVWSITGQQGSRSLVEGGCHYAVTESSSYRFAGPWEALFGFDTMIFAWTIYYAYSAHRQRMPQTNLHTVIVRDGAMYFGLIALANLANISTYYFAQIWPFFPGSLATFANCMSVTMISRLILNLHERADAGILTEPTESAPQPNPPLSLTSILMSEAAQDGIPVSNSRFASLP